MIHQSSLYGLPTVLIDTDLARCEISLLGAQVLSFIPRSDGRDLLWCGAGPHAAGSPPHGGIPVCWPWFAKQDRPPDAVQHGFARHMTWRLAQASPQPDQQVHLVLRLDAPQGSWPQGEGWPARCQPELEVVVGTRLSITLKTVHAGPQPLVLTQALHNYFRVGDVRQTRISGLSGLRYLDKLRGFEAFVQEHDWTFADACDRIYLETGPHHRIDDPVLQRSILIETEHSHSTVVWNPGAQGIKAFADIPPGDWHQYLCLEAANCAPLDRVALAPGGTASLTQHISVMPLSAAPPPMHPAITP